MTKFRTSILVGITAASLVFGQDSTKQDVSSRLAGTWKSLDNENGEPLAVVTFMRAEKKLSGTVVLRGLKQGANENVTLELGITDPTLEGRILSFRLKFPEPEAMVTGWEFSLRGDDEAGFKLVTENDKPIESGPSFVMKRMKSS